jgi:hypothetical protein
MSELDYARESGPDDGWCDNCRGYTHMPYCSAYIEPVQLTEEDCQLIIGAIPLQALPSEPEPRCPHCGETKANHGDYSTGEDWVCPELGDRSVGEIKAAYNSWRAFHCTPENAQAFEQQNEQMHRDIGVLLRVLESRHTPRQPAPAGEWCVVRLSIHGWGITCQGRELVSGIYREETAMQIISNHYMAGLVEGLVETLERYVKAYEGNKAAMLGNGQARRSLDEFKELLATLSKERGRG